MLRYEFLVKGMKCSSCSNKIEEALKEFKEVKTANVNLITERVLVAIDNEDMVEKIKDKLTKMGFKVSPFKKLELNGDNKFRVIHISTKEFEKAKEILRDLVGIERIDQTPTGININYDPILIKGWEIYEALENNHFIFSYSNELINKINEMNSFSLSISKLNFFLCCVLTSVLLTNTMIFPKFSLGEFLMSTFLYQNSVSLSLLITFSISFAIMYLYGFYIIKRAWIAFYYFRLLNMETLIALGSLSALALSVLNVTKLLVLYLKSNATLMDIMNKEMALCHSLEAAATVISISVIGKYIEENAKLNIRKHTSMMFSQEKLAFGNTALKVKPGNKGLTWFLSEKKVDVGLLEKDDFVKINSGEFLLYDSIIMSGEVFINESMTYGFEKIEKKVVGDRLKSGCEVEKGSCVVSVTDVLEESVLFKVTKEMNESLNQKLKFQIFIDRIVTYFVPVVIFISAVTFSVWLVIYLYKSDEKEYLTFMFVIERAISVLVVSCPCAFGLAIPTVTTIAMNAALKNGLLIKNLALLPEIKDAKNIVFDKTGTLTEIRKEVKQEYKIKDSQSVPVYTMLSIIEKEQKHPIAEVLYSFALKNIEENSTVSLSSDIEKVSSGITAIFNCQNSTCKFSVGNKHFIESQIGKTLKDSVYCPSNINGSVVYIAVDDEVVLVLSIDTSTEIRKEAGQVINLLKDMGKQVFILSGDKKDSVKLVGEKLGIKEENIFGEVDNKKKKEFFQKLKQNNEKSMMVGDGVNDILSLSEADFGISFNAASQLNLVAADIIFIKEDLKLILVLLKLSKLTFIFIWLNIFWAFIYNICLLPITAGVFHSIWDVEMSPTLSSFSMLCSSLFIVLTSNTMRMFSLKHKLPKHKIGDANYISLKIEEVITVPNSNDAEDLPTNQQRNKYYEFE